MAALKSFEATRRRAGALNRRPPRVEAIDVQQIVGSVDGVKAQMLTADFLPRAGRQSAPRYRSVLTAMQQERPLPAIEVYSLGGEYFVMDGHHRVAAARALGYVYLDAVVHEFPMPCVGERERADQASAQLRPARWRAGARPRRLAWVVDGLQSWLRPDLRPARPRTCR